MPGREHLPVPARLALIERELDQLRRELDTCVERVDAMTVEDRIRAGVRKELQARTNAVANVTADRVAQTGAPILLTTAQKIGGAIAALILILDAVRGFVG